MLKFLFHVKISSYIEFPEENERSRSNNSRWVHPQWVKRKLRLHVPPFYIFLGVYLFIAMESLGMIILILFSAHLNTPGMVLLSASGNSFLLPRLLFCKSNMINHYFCNLLLLLELSCSNTFISEVLVLFLCVFSIVLPVMTILSSYIFIIVTFLQINEMRADPRQYMQLPRFSC